MAFSVAKILKVRPLDIINKWSCEELLVTFGVYTNELMYSKYLEYQALDSKSKELVKTKPVPYAIKFLTFEQMDELVNKTLSEEEIKEEAWRQQLVEQFMKGGGMISG